MPVPNRGGWGWVHLWSGRLLITFVVRISDLVVVVVVVVVAVIFRVIVVVVVVVVVDHVVIVQL